MDEVEKELDGQKVFLAKLNIDDNIETARQYGVMTIPTLIVFKGGKNTASITGMKTKSALLEFINKNA